MRPIRTAAEMATREEVAIIEMGKGSESGSRELYEGDGHSSVDSEEWESDVEESLDRLPGSGGQEDGPGRDVPLEEAGSGQLLQLSESGHHKELHSQEVESAQSAQDEVEMYYNVGSLSHESNGPAGGDGDGRVLQESEPLAHEEAQEEHPTGNGAEILHHGGAEYAQDEKDPAAAFTGDASEGGGIAPAAPEHVVGNQVSLAGDRTDDLVARLTEENVALKAEMSKQANEMEALARENYTLREEMSQAEAAQIEELKMVHQGLHNLKAKADEDKEKSRSRAEDDAAMIAQLKEQLAEHEATLRLLENPMMQEDSDSSSVPEQPESDQQSEAESEPSEAFLPRGVPSKMDNMIAAIRELEQTNTELQEKVLVAEAQLRQPASQPEPPTSDDKSLQNSLAAVADAGDLGETNSRLSEKLAAAKERINELESRIKTIEGASSKQPGLTSEESNESLAKMLMLEGKLADSLQTAEDSKQKLMAEKKRLEEDHARLQEEMDGTKARCAVLEAEVQQVIELEGLLSAAENKCSEQMASIAALESRISELQNTAACKSDLEPSMAPRELAEPDDPSGDLHSDTALSQLVDYVELSELRRLESLRLTQSPPVAVTAKVVEQSNLPVAEPQAVIIAAPVSESALAAAQAEVANLKAELQAMRFQAAEQQSKLAALEPQAVVTTAAPVSETALAEAEAKIANLKAELQATKFELRREETANAPGRSADWNKAFNPSPRDTQRVLEDAAHLPREGLMAELERVCDLRQEAAFVAELRKEQLDRGVKQAGQTSAEIAQLKGKIRAQSLKLLEAEEKTQQKQRDIELLQTKYDNMKKILEDEDAHTGITNLKKKLKKTYKKVKAKDSTIKHHLDEGKHLWQEVNSLLSVARPASVDAVRRLGITTTAPVTPFGKEHRTTASPHKRTAREIMFGSQSPPPAAPTRRAWDTPAEASPAWAGDTTPGMVPNSSMHMLEEDEFSSSADSSAGNSRICSRPSSARHHSARYHGISEHNRQSGPYRQYHAFS